MFAATAALPPSRTPVVDDRIEHLRRQCRAQTAALLDQLGDWSTLCEKYRDAATAAPVDVAPESYDALDALDAQSNDLEEVESARRLIALQHAVAADYAQLSRHIDASVRMLLEFTAAATTKGRKS